MKKPSVPGYESDVRIAPSLLSADFGCLSEQLAIAEAGGADLYHFDVMDGHFVPNLSFGPHILKCVRRITKLRLDVHLMVENPMDFLEPFKDAGADSIFFHPEVTANVPRMVRRVRNFDVLVGLAINPETPADVIIPHLKEIDLVLVMSVHPGFGGQKFLPESVEKIRTIRQAIDRGEYRAQIAVDGGINKETSAIVRQAGAHILVAGYAIFESGDIPGAIKNLKGK